MILIRNIAKTLTNPIFFNPSDGKLIPKGANIVIPTLLLGRNPDNFPNPEKFIPERFDKSIDENKRNPFVYVPFSAGK